MIDNHTVIGYNKEAETNGPHGLFLLPNRFNNAIIVNQAADSKGPDLFVSATAVKETRVLRLFIFQLNSECKTATCFGWSPDGRRFCEGHSAMNEVLTKAILPHLNISRNTQFKESSGLPRSLTVSFRASGLRAAITWQFMARPQSLSILTCDPPYNSPIPSAPIADTSLPGAGASLLRGACAS